MTTAWTYNGVTYNPSTVSYNNYSSANTYIFSWLAADWWNEQFAWYNAGGYVTFEQTASAVGLGIWALTLAIIVLVWDGLPEDWKNLLLNVDSFDPNAFYD